MKLDGVIGKPYNRRKRIGGWKMDIKPGKTKDGRSRASRIRAVDRWAEKNYERLFVKVPAGRKSIYQAAAKNAGLSMRAWLIQNLDRAAGFDPDRETDQERDVVQYDMPPETWI
jgi:hypothetical protein